MSNEERLKTALKERVLVPNLRKALGPCADGVSDAKILELTEGTMLKARVELGCACEKFRLELCKAFGIPERLLRKECDK